MQVIKIKRSYSRSINARNYNLPESWIRCEAEYEAKVESGDDPVKVSQMIADQAQAEVIEQINTITTKMKEASQNLQVTASGGTPTAPAAPATPTNPQPRQL